MKVNIVSDGTGASTRVYGPTGLDITEKLPIRSIEWRVDAADMARANIELDLVGADFDAEVDFYMKHPRSGEMKRLKRIEFDDGTEVEFGEVVKVSESSAPKFAKGGFVSKGLGLALTGESGPESIIPRSLYDSIIAAHEASYGTVVVNITVNSDEVAEEGLSEKIGESLSAQIRKAIADELRRNSRPGGILRQGTHQ